MRAVYNRARKTTKHGFSCIQNYKEIKH